MRGGKIFRFKGIPGRDLAITSDWLRCRQLDILPSSSIICLYRLDDRHSFGASLFPALLSTNRPIAQRLGVPTAHTGIVISGPLTAN